MSWRHALFYRSPIWCSYALGGIYSPVSRRFPKRRKVPWSMHDVETSRPLLPSKGLKLTRKTLPCVVSTRSGALRLLSEYTCWLGSDHWLGEIGIRKARSWQLNSYRNMDAGWHTELWSWEGCMPLLRHPENGSYATKHYVSSNIVVEPTVLFSN